MNTMPPFSFLNELPKPDWDALERMINDAGLMSVVSAISILTAWKAATIRAEGDERLAKRWDKASNVLAKIGYTRGLKA